MRQETPAVPDEDPPTAGPQLPVMPSFGAEEDEPEEEPELPEPEDSDKPKPQPGVDRRKAVRALRALRRRTGKQ